jgi:uncharacterized Zn-binding protein involved in type VI secretion
MQTPAVVPIPHVGGPILPPGQPTVLIAGMPAAVVGDMCVCVGPPDVIAMGSAGVMIGGRPAARMGDMTIHGGSIVVGCPTVLIGETGSAGGGGGGMGGAAFGGVAGPQQAAMSAAKQAGSAFLETGCETKAAIASITEPAKFESATRSAADNKPDPQKTWVEIEVAFADGAPMSLEYYRVEAAGNVVREGWTDANGKLRLEGLDPGDCKISFPDIEAAVRKATASESDR